MRAKEHQDSAGTHYTVEAEREHPEIEVWWNRTKHRSAHKQQEWLVLRQGNEADKTDVILLTPGQVYDLIDALNRAVENW